MMIHSKRLEAFGILVCVATVVLIGAKMHDSGDAKDAQKVIPSKRERSHARLRAVGIEEIRRMPSGKRRADALVSHYASMSLDEIKNSKEHWRQLDVEELELLVSRWVALDPYSAMDYIESLDVCSNHWYLEIAVEKWTAIDPESAARHSDEMRSRSPFTDLVSGASVRSVIASKWAKLDLPGALEWGKRLEERDQDVVLAEVMTVLAKQDPAKAASMFDTMDLPSAKRTREKIAEIYGSQDFEAAQDWVRSLAEAGGFAELDAKTDVMNDAMNDAMNATIRGLAMSDFDAAQAYVISMQPSRQKDTLIVEVAKITAASAPQEAARFLEEHANKDALEDSVSYLIPQWVKIDPNKALDYAMSLRNENTRDKALSAYVNSTPDVGYHQVQVLESMSSDFYRKALIGRSIMYWMKQDRVAAAAYLEATIDLTDDQKKQILGVSP